ncbi:MAG TPA: hypothetical protein VJS11_05260 [Acidobacteriaceae bacterium]|nr:hypothetical protein [Acidobacteriaceae bacterium]
MSGSPTLTEPAVPANAALEQIQRIAASVPFRGAPTLQTLLRFLAAKALEKHPEEIKEYTIGVEALGRRQDFDPKTDPIVRVQVHRLRQKLKEYYDLEGSGDPIVVQIPKGHYLPSFDMAAAIEAVAGPVPVRRREPAKDFHDKKVISPTKPRFAATLVVAVLCTALGFASGYWLHKTQNAGEPGIRAAGVPAYLAPADDPVQKFWAPFIREDPSPIVAYADAMFLLDQSADLFRFRHGASYDRGAPVDPHVARQFTLNPELVAKAGPLFYDNGYTGTGELQGVAMLISVLTQMGATPTVESSFDITTTDLTQHNVILLGSPFQNVAVEQLPPAGDFAFVDPATMNDLWNGRIVDSHPLPGERPMYQTERDPVTHVVRADYALVSFLPGVRAGRHIVDLGGLDTTGTAGAVMLATSKPGVEAMSVRVGGMSNKIPEFQALLRVNLEKGYQVLDTRLVGVHPIQVDAPRPAAHSPSHAAAE